MKLYSHPFSQHARRVRMLCEELNIALDIRNMSLETGAHKSEDFLALNPTGRVPVLDDDGFVLSESHAIMKYVVAKSGTYEFYPIDVKKRAEVDMWLDWNHTKLNPPVQSLIIQVMFMGENADQALVGKSRSEASDALAILETALAAGSSIGGTLTLADLSLASTVALYEMAEGNLSALPSLKAWLDTIKARPGFAGTAPVS